MMNVPFDTNSPEWEVICRYLEADLLQAYKEAVRLDLSQDKTQQVKGRAAYISKLLSLGKAPSRVTAQDEFTGVGN